MAHDAPVQHAMIDRMLDHQHCLELALRHIINRCRAHAEQSRQFRLDPLTIFQDIEDAMKISMGQEP